MIIQPVLVQHNHTTLDETLPASYTTLLTVPAGQMYQVSIFSTNTSISTPATVTVKINSFYIMNRKSHVLSETINISGLVLSAGTTISVANSGAICDYTITGIATTL